MSHRENNWVRLHRKLSRGPANVQNSGFRLTSHWNQSSFPGSFMDRKMLIRPASTSRTQPLLRGTSLPRRTIEWETRRDLCRAQEHGWRCWSPCPFPSLRLVPWLSLSASSSTLALSGAHQTPAASTGARIVRAKRARVWARRGCEQVLRWQSVPGVILLAAVLGVWGTIRSREWIVILAGCLMISEVFPLVLSFWPLALLAGLGFFWTAHQMPG